MAITVLVGLQGAGKTYYAVAEIWKHIKKMHAAEINNTTYKYKYIYTNIEGFIPNKYVRHLKFAELENLWKWENEQYKKFENITRPQDLPALKFTLNKKKIETNIQKFDPFDMQFREADINDNIQIIENSDERIFKHIYNKESEEIESDYINYTKPLIEKQDFTDCLIVIDEAHNHFKKSLSAALKRLASYHRHYDQDYILITQDLNQLPRYITNLSVFTIKAVSPAIRLKSDLFTYKVYSGGYISYRDDNKLETKRLKANPYIFGLYQSGSVKIPRSSMYKILALIFLLICVLVGSIYIYKNSLHNKDKKVVVTKKTTIKQPENKTKISTPKTLITFYKVGNELIYKNKRINYIVFNALLSPADELLYSYRQQDNTYIYKYLLTNKTLEKIGIGVPHENLNQNINANKYLSNPFESGLQ